MTWQAPGTKKDQRHASNSGMFAAMAVIRYGMMICVAPPPAACHIAFSINWIQVADLQPGPRIEKLYKVFTRTGVQPAPCALTKVSEAERGVRGAQEEDYFQQVRHIVKSDAPMLPQPPAKALAVPTMFGENMMEVLQQGSRLVSKLRYLELRGLDGRHLMTVVDAAGRDRYAGQCMFFFRQP